MVYIDPEMYNSEIAIALLKVPKCVKYPYIH